MFSQKEYNGQLVSFELTDDVMICLTDMAKATGKKVNDWTRLKSTEEYLEQYSSVTGIPVSECFQQLKGGNQEQGTWANQDIALEFARWCSPKFSIWCNRQIKELLKTGVVALPSVLSKADLEQIRLRAAAERALASSAKARLSIEKFNQALSESRLNHANKLQQIKDKHTKIMAQGSKLKADGSISKLSLPVDTITNLLKLHGSMLKPSDANNMLKRLGYLSDDGSEVTDAGSFYGRTIKSSESSNTTLPRWFKEEFGVLLSAIMQEWDIVNE